MNNTVNSLNLRRYKFSESHFTNKQIAFPRPCIGYLLKGEARFLCEGNTFYAKEGDLIYIASGTVYYSFWTGFPEIDFYSLDFDYTEPQELEKYRFQIVKCFPREHLNAMYEINEADRFMALSHFYAMLSELFRRLSPSEQLSPTVSIAPAIEMLEARPRFSVSVEEMANACSLSQSYFYTVFKRQTGITPVEYKNNLLIRHAVYYLKYSSLSIEEISSALGFSSSNYFRRVFFSVMKQNPRDLKKSVM